MSATDRKMKMAELRIENNNLRDERNSHVRTNAELLKECDALRAENERLRKALKDINITACYGWRDAEEALAKIATDAAAALSQSTDESEQPEELVGSPVGELSEREYQLKHSNPYDASGLPNEPTDD